MFGSRARLLSPNTEEITAVIAAGGYATRLGCKYPKPFIEVDHIPLLRHWLFQINRIGITNILVFTNRPEWYSATEAACDGFPARVETDKGFSCSLELAKLALRYTDASKILFLYGHAPRPSEIITSICDLGSLFSAGMTSTSSRREILSFGAGFLEPPFVIARSILQTACASTWGELAYEIPNQCKTIKINGPCEFNQREEMVAYLNYVRTWGQDFN